MMKMISLCLNTSSRSKEITLKHKNKKFDSKTSTFLNTYTAFNIMTGKEVIVSVVSHSNAFIKNIS